MPSKREKRLARQALKDEKFEEKKARQALELEIEKAPVGALNNPPRKTAKQEPFDERRAQMSWTRDYADIEGQWSWGSRSCLIDDWDDELEPFLVDCARKTWVEIYDERTGGAARRRKHISYNVEQICHEAQRRLLEIERDDIDRLFRFRLAGRKRLYGVQQTAVFQVLWWDPEHNIYPVGAD